MIKLILLDIDNTLLDFNACAKATMRAVFEEFYLPFEEPMFAVFTEVNNALWKEIELGKLTKDELYAVRWNRIFGRLGIAADGVAFERRFHALLAYSVEMVPGAREMVEYLAGKYKLGVASNGWKAQQRTRLKNSGLLPYVKYFFFSESIGASKPSPAFFDACIRAAAPLQPQEILMLGDAFSADIQGAAACGLKTCWYDPNGITPPDDSADYVIHALEEVRNIL